MKRRTWILSALGATGVLVVGWSVLPQRSRLGTSASMLPTEGDVALNGWIKITPAGQVILAMPRSEMGQGVHTALAMLVRLAPIDTRFVKATLDFAGPAVVAAVLLVPLLRLRPRDAVTATGFALLGLVLLTLFAFVIVWATAL